MISPQEALERLRSGNQRFVSGQRLLETRIDQMDMSELAAGQEPFAIILGCSDSRVPAEIIFDQGLGDLFVIRVAGNIVAPCQIGSIEFAAERFGTRLVVVLGHTGCGAISATLSEIQQPSKHLSDNLCSIVDCIRPAVEELMTTDLKHDQAALAREAMRANVRAAVRLLYQDSPTLARLMQTDGLRILGAEYLLETGVVDFFD